MDPEQYTYPLHIARTLHAAAAAFEEGDSSRGDHEDMAETRHSAASLLADALISYLGALAVGQYSNALYREDVAADPTLNRSLRSLRRVLPGQWLLWTARGLDAVPDGPLAGMADWYKDRAAGDVADAYTELRSIMTERLSYTGEYGAREDVSPRDFLELVDQYRVRRARAPEGSMSHEQTTAASAAMLMGLHALIRKARFLSAYSLYSTGERKFLMGLKPAMLPEPPSMPSAAAETATLLLYPPARDGDEERLPLFPLDPLLAYLQCGDCHSRRIAALSEVPDGVPLYTGLDPQCGHALREGR